MLLKARIKGTYPQKNRRKGLFSEETQMCYPQNGRSNLKRFFSIKFI